MLLLARRTNIHKITVYMIGPTHFPLALVLVKLIKLTKSFITMIIKCYFLLIGSLSTQEGEVSMLFIRNLNMVLAHFPLHLKS